jgi:hypothetical protein
MIRSVPSFLTSLHFLGPIKNNNRSSSIYSKVGRAAVQRVCHQALTIFLNRVESATESSDRVTHRVFDVLFLATALDGDRMDSEYSLRRAFAYSILLDRNLRTD